MVSKNLVIHKYCCHLLHETMQCWRSQSVAESVRGTLLLLQAMIQVIYFLSENFRSKLIFLSISAICYLLTFVSLSHILEEN